MEAVGRGDGSSRTPVREAIRKLELEGFVMVPRRGAYVSDLSVKDVVETYEIRSALEALAAGLAADRITDDEEGVGAHSRSGRRESPEERSAAPISLMRHFTMCLPCQPMTGWPRLSTICANIFMVPAYFPEYARPDGSSL